MRLTSWWARQQLPLRDVLRRVLLLTAVLAFTGCSESPSYVKPGPLFAAAEKAPPLQAQIYFYWLAEEPDQWNHLSIGSCEGAYETVRPGGYVRVLVAPGRQCLTAESWWSWNVQTLDVSSGRELASLDLNVAAGQTVFVRVEKDRGLLFSGMALRPVEPARAAPEIKRCGQMIPMTEDEMLREWQARESS